MNKIELTTAIAALDSTEAALDVIETAWENAPEDTALEADWTTAYEAHHAAWQKVVSLLRDFSGGILDEHTIRIMFAKKRPELDALIARWAD